MAVVENAILVAEQHCGDVLEGLEPLPLQLIDPAVEVIERGLLLAVVPRSFQAFLQQIRRAIDPI